MPHEAGRVTDPNRVSRERAVDATRSISPRVWNDRYAFVPIMPQDRGFGAEPDERCRFPHLADAAGRSPGRHSRLDGASLRRGDSFRSPTPNTRPLVSRVGEGTASLSSGNAAHLQPSGGISTARGRAGTIRGKDALTSALRSASRAPAAPAHSGSADGDAGEDPEQENPPSDLGWQAKVLRVEISSRRARARSRLGSSCRFSYYELPTPAGALSRDLEK